MSSLNKVILLGNVGKVETKDFGNGRKIVNVSLATSESYKKNDEWVEKTEWHRCVFSIPTLVDRAESINKGDKIYIEGKISTNSWETKEGEKKEIKEISCTSFQFFLRSKEGAKAQSEAPKPKAAPSQEEDGDIPF